MEGAAGRPAPCIQTGGSWIFGGMIGETTLAMLYVPLLFYLFEKWNEHTKAKQDAQSGKDSSDKQITEAASHEKPEDD